MAPIEEKMIITHLRWFGHVRKRPNRGYMRNMNRTEATLVNNGRGRSNTTTGYTI